MTTRLIHADDMPRFPDAIYIGPHHAGRRGGPSFKRSKWASPWAWQYVGRQRANALFRRWIDGDPAAAAMVPPGNWHLPTVEEIRHELAGKILACWCKPGQPCHGIVLAEIANGVQQTRRA